MDLGIMQQSAWGYLISLPSPVHLLHTVMSAQSVKQWRSYVPPLAISSRFLNLSRWFQVETSNGSDLSGGM